MLGNEPLKHGNPATPRWAVITSRLFKLSQRWCIYFNHWGFLRRDMTLECAVCRPSKYSILLKANVTTHSTCRSRSHNCRSRRVCDIIHLLALASSWIKPCKYCHKCRNGPVVVRCCRQRHETGPYLAFTACSHWHREYTSEDRRGYCAKRNKWPSFWT